MKYFLLAACLGASSPVFADIISEQNERLILAYDRYIDDCFDHTDLSDKEKSAMESRGEPPGCEVAKEAYAQEGDLLVRLIHGDAPILCTGDDCPELKDQ